MIDSELIGNRTFSNTPAHFSELRPESIPPEGVSDPAEARRRARTERTGAIVLPGGDVMFRMYAPHAHSVTVDIEAHKIHVELTQGPDGMWEALFPYRFSGPKALEWRVDGTYVLHPYCSLYFSYNKAVNYVDIPDPRVESVLIGDVPHGTVRHEYFYSSATSNWESCVVYTPPGYDTDGLSYPILYLQHGAGEGETSWIWNGKANFIMDNLIAQGRCVPFIIVMNDGMMRSPGEGDRPMAGPRRFDTFSKMLLEDCMPFIEGRYRVLDGKWNRAMAGLSMGSMQTSVIGLTHPEHFGWLGLFSGFLGLPGNEYTVEAQPHLAPFLDLEKFAGDFRLFFRAIGEDDALKRSFDNDEEFLEKAGASPDRLPIHVRRIYPGIHDWGVWRMCLTDFVQLLFK